MYELFKKHLEEKISLGHDAWDDMLNILHDRKVASQSMYLQKGGKAVNETFVTEGILRSYYISSEGEEINVAFYAEGNVLPPLHFRSKNSLSLIHIQALTDVTLCEFDAHAFTALRYKHSALMNYGNRIIEQELEYKTQREILLLSYTAADRYLYFRKAFPGLENRISQYHIASYLGITPVSLSRIRKELAEK